MTRSRAYLGPILDSRRALLELILAAVVVGLGVNVLAGLFLDALPDGLVLASGVVVTLTGLALVATRGLRLGQQVHLFEGVFFYDRSHNEVLGQVWGLFFPHHIARYLRALFVENEAIKAAWDRSPLMPKDRRVSSERAKNQSSRELIRQATEYFVLGHLSTHLMDWFRLQGISDNELDHLSHRDVPDVLLENLFLKVFTEPIAERPVFGQPTEDRDEGAVFMMMTSSGALYERFELVLPKGSSLNRISQDTVEIQTARFNIRIRTSCPGIAAVVPRDYERYYAGLSARDGGLVAQSTVRAEITIQPHRLALISPRGWHLYRWIDSWLDQLDKDMSLERHLTEIGWSSAETTLTLMKNWEAERAAKKEARDDDDLKGNGD